MRTFHVSCSVLLLLLAGCIPSTSERNPFWTVTETYGISAGTETEAPGGGPGAEAEGEFRRDLTLTLTNNHETANMETSFAAWVNVSSIRSAEQQDALLRGGYVQLNREIRLGTAFTLVPGTFVYNGPGLAGATPVTLACPLTETADRTLSREFTLITPDVILMFSQPPVSCDSTAFIFDSVLVPGEETVTGAGGFKTLAQVDVYQCEPLRPGLFFRSGGGAKQPNEFYEGDSILFEFNEAPDAGGNFAIVTISS
jgi:hypothetical protein